MRPKSSNAFLANQELQLILFGGKGGTGKTTCAVATGIHLARMKKDKKILVVSTDPAHSVVDSLDCPIGSEITAAKDIENLWALEIDTETALADFRKRHGAVMRQLADRGTYFDEQDIADFFSLSLPGLDEVMGIIEIARLLNREEYHVIILDTAPTGHTLRLLDLPEQMGQWVHVFDLMQDKHRYMMKRLAGRNVKDEADAFLERLGQDLGRVRSLLRNQRTTEFVPVTIPEPLSLAETEKLVCALRDRHIPVKSIIVNRLAEADHCSFCFSRKQGAERYLKEIEEKFAAYNLVPVPLFPHEIRGVADLTEVGNILFGPTYNGDARANDALTGGLREWESGRVGEWENGRMGEWESGRAGERKMPAPIRPLAPSPPRPLALSDLLERERTLILFGGKGGVGKTSLAAATALCLARRDPTQKILIFSTDPAPSLSDSFGCLIADRAAPINGVNNLYGLEINAARLLDEFKEKYKTAIEEVFDRFMASGLDVKFDREVMAELISLAPPGLDEMMALRTIMELRANEQYDRFILDTAPTGHLLRFLELPELVRDWLKYLFKLLLKYKRVVGLSRTAAELVELSKSLRRIRDLLTNAQETEFVAITIPEAMSVREMERLLASLKKLNIPCAHILINMVIPDTSCRFCAIKRSEQQKQIEVVKKLASSECVVTEVPLLRHDVKGMNDLGELANVMYGEWIRKIAECGMQNAD